MSKRSSLSSLFLVTCCFLLIICDAKRTPEALRRFQDWFFKTIKLEGKPKIELQFVGDKSDDIGIYANEDIKEDAHLISIPLNVILHTKRIKEATVLGEILLKEAELLDDKEVIALYILMLRYCDPAINPFELWIKLLPPKLNTILYFSDEELEYLKGTSIYESSKELIRKSKLKFEVINRQIIQKYPEHFKCIPTYNMWKWAVSIVTSRKVELLDEEGKVFAAVVPFFDFFNHNTFDNDKFSWGYKASHKFFHAEALTSYKRGQQIFQSYGTFSNEKLISEYGFFVENNPFESLAVPTSLLGVDPEDPLVTTKERLLNELREKKAGKFIMTKQGISQELLRVAQIINAFPEDFVGDDNLKIKDLSQSTEMAVAVWFQSVCVHMLNGYPTKLQDDHEFAKSARFKTLSIRLQMAVKLRITEQEILHYIGNVFHHKEISLRGATNKKEEL